MKCHWILVALVLSPALLLPGAALAEGMQIEPGSWQFESTSRMPMSPTPRVQKTSECLTVSELTPDRFVNHMEDCSISDAEADAGSMQWQMACPNPVGEMRGSGRFTSTGDSIRGSMSMSMTLNGKPMEVRVDWTGKRLGPC